MHKVAGRCKDRAKDERRQCFLGMLVLISDVYLVVEPDDVRTGQGQGAAITGHASLPKPAKIGLLLFRSCCCRRGGGREDILRA